MNMNLRVQNNQEYVEELLDPLSQNPQVHMINFTKSTGSIEIIEPVLTMSLDEVEEMQQDYSYQNKTEYCQNEKNLVIQDHVYYCQSCYPAILNLKERIKSLEKTCADQKAELGTVRRKLNLSEIRVSNFKSGKIPKTVKFVQEL